MDPLYVAILQPGFAAVIGGVHKSIRWREAGVAPPPVVMPSGADLSGVMGGVATTKGGSE